MAEVRADHIVMPGDGQKYISNDGHTTSSRQTPRSPWTYVLLALLVVLLIFPVITIPILFWQYSKINSNYLTSTVYQSSVSAILGEGLRSTGPLSAQGAVSLNTAGEVQVGGGTSIYRQIGSIPAESCPKYLSATPMFDDSYLVSYKSFETGTGVINVMKVDSSNKATVKSSRSNAQDLYHVVTLNQETGLFVTISQATTKGATTAVIAGKVDKANSYAITYGSETVYSFPAAYSFDPSITALSATTFAIAFYGGTPLTCYTRWGTVDPVTLAVTLSNFLPFQDDSTYETYITLTALTSTKYLAVSYIGSTTAPVGVTSQVISTSTLSNGTLVAKAFGVSSEFTGSRPNGVIRATALDENNVVVAYSDINSNYGITCVSLSINSFTGAVKYGAVLAITTGYTAKFISSGDININLVTIKAGSQFMLMFSDLSLNGALIAVIGQNINRMLVRASPNFVLNEGIAKKNNMHAFISLAVSKMSTASTTVALLSTMTDAKCNKTFTPITDFSIMEIKPRPLGIMTAASSSAGALDSSSLIVSGIVGGFSGLTVGATYYTTTSGKLVSNKVVESSGPSLAAYTYITDMDTKTIVSADSEIGIAITSTSILLRVKA